MIAWLYRYRFWSCIGLFLILADIARQLNAFVCSDGTKPLLHVGCTNQGDYDLHIAWLVMVVISWIAPLALWILLARWNKKQRQPE